MGLSTQIFCLCLFLSCNFIKSNLADEAPNREGKFLNPFYVVTFKNDRCTSLSTDSTGTREGTCRTTSECSTHGGQASGNCASGFGVCCLIFKTSGTIDQNCTYLRNEGFPNSFTGTSNPTYTIQKCSSNVCAIRLDFMSFTIGSTPNTFEANAGAAQAEADTDGGICQDTFDVVTSAGLTFPTICGQNTGQHIYVEMGTAATDTAQISFQLTTTGTRMWEIKATQIPCGANWRNIPGCLQYHTGITGTISTFNFLDEAGSHSRNQQYTACIRQEVGYCCVEYMACADANSMSILTKGNGALRPRSEAACGNGNGEDKIIINGAQDVCTQESGRAGTFSRLCGTVFTVANQAGAGVTPTYGVTTVCDCTEPFQVSIFTDNDGDQNGGVSNTAQSRGVCLNYRQVPCAHV